ncbi:MAG: shikimate dehydrogenase [Bacteroidales bacterium]|jgi:shikimate dehydrogenase|nr:shikimate dehydrogenase [Bacteroidales bacterium]MDD4385140.1 shikimate dehydrogenase [Bacteroidales bacterium]MDY0199000.1 shikimate dehydrogenase [Tenuifilaceae bacterium]
METSKLFAVFGNPILHSKSPQLFNSVFRSFGINAFYTRIRPQSAANLIDIIRTMPISGANISAPFKRDVLDLVDIVSLDAEKIGAINTIVNCDGRLIGYNTDHYGVTQSLKEAGINLLNSNCLVLGGGGAARAAVYGLMKQGAKVFSCNRTISKAKSIADDFGCTLMNWQEYDSSFNFDVVVSTIVPEAIPCFTDSVKFKYLFDASYKPSIVYQIAQAKGAKVISGERWLLHQAIESFRLFIGDNPPLEVMENALAHKLNKLDLKILNYPDSTTAEMCQMQADLIISSSDMNSATINEITDEETRKAFTY